MTKDIRGSSKKVTFDKINATLAEDTVFASAMDVVMDKNFIEKSRHDWCWVSWENVPTQTGWYQVDRNNEKLIKITTTEAAKLQWHERMFVYGSGHAAVKENSPLALYIGGEYEDGRLSALYLCGPDVLTWVAQASSNVS